MPNIFTKIASKLARKTKDSEKDKSLDLNIAQSSHVLKVLRSIYKEDAIVRKFFGARTHKDTINKSIKNTDSDIKDQKNKSRRLIFKRYSTKHSRKGM